MWRTNYQLVKLGYNIYMNQGNKVGALMIDAALKETPELIVPKKRGRPAKQKFEGFDVLATQRGTKIEDIMPEPVDKTVTFIATPDLQQQVVEVIKEVFITKEVIIPEKKLEGFQLYKALKDSGFFQGGVGQFMEDVNGTEKVYIPHASEIYQSFAQDPQGWDTVRDYLARAFLEIKDQNGK